MKRRKQNQETLTFDEEDVKEKPLMMKKNRTFDREEEEEPKLTNKRNLNFSTQKDWK